MDTFLSPVGGTQHFCDKQETKISFQMCMPRLLQSPRIEPSLVAEEGREADEMVNPEKKQVELNVTKYF